MNCLNVFVDAVDSDRCDHIVLLHAVLECHDDNLDETVVTAVMDNNFLVDMNDAIVVVVVVVVVVRKEAVEVDFGEVVDVNDMVQDGVMQKEDDVHD